MKKWSLAVNIFGWLETIAGVIGTIFFIIFAIVFAYYRLFPLQDSKVGEEAGWSLGFMLFFLPSVILMWAGVGMLRRLPKALTVNIVLSAALLIFTVIIHAVSRQIMYGIPYALFFAAIVLLLILSGVRKQFNTKDL